MAERGEVIFPDDRVPAIISERMAVGAEYHIVIRCFSINRYQVSAVNPTSMTHWVTPKAKGAMMP